ncbi:pro-MCH [Pangasianodon hypophthalmus]|uniref:pro-MCH n=1 Tax=Pangasianodon hypophthalmus TaxID=310915 RepID=UPI00147AD904|nr:pro-MCH [Pangasianodon hypophthalmus]
MMINSSSLIFALALLVNSFARSATLALPESRIQDDIANQDSFSSVMDEDGMNIAGPSDFSPRRFPLIEGRLADEHGTKRIFILSDLGSKGASGSDASSGFGRAFTVLSPWRIDRALAATQKDEWHNADDLIPMAKRNMDNKMLRCMIGRVYRPCWQA